MNENGIRRRLAAAIIGTLLGSVASTAALAEAVDRAEPEPEADPAIVQKSGDREDLPSLADVLDAEADETATAKPVRCLRTFQIRSHRIIDPQHIVFRMRNGDMYLSKFPNRCIGLRRGDGIALETRSGRLCRMDALRPINRLGFANQPGAPCFIRDFEPVTAEQIDYLVESLKRPSPIRDKAAKKS
ncbi:MAG: DUF6491 family protein [Pseudomonadota bacterium]